MLTLQKREPEWLEVLAGVRIRFAPLTMASVRAARRSCRSTLEGRETDDLEALEAGADALTAELVRRGILDWEGIADAEGNPVAPSAETIELLIADPIAFEACEAAYVRPYVARVAEGNGSSASSNGMSAAATRASATASSAAGAANAATSAPTSSTRPKRPKAKRS